MKKPRKWKWMPFTNPARSDDAVFYHWRRPSDEQKEYPFAKFNKVGIFRAKISKNIYKKRFFRNWIYQRILI